MTDDTDSSGDPTEGTFAMEHRPGCQPVGVDTETPRAIPFYVIKAAVERAGPDDEYAVVRSDNDYEYAETLPEADRLAEEFRLQTDTVSPIPHTVQVVDVQEVPPDA